MRVKHLLAGALWAGVLMGAASRAPANEEVFKTALKYTVQVRATLPVPFDGDRKGSGLGAGFVVDAERGWIMTNAHVVGRSPSRVEVAFHGRDFVEATKVYVDPFLDVAILRLTDRAAASGVEAPRLECGSVPPVGHPVGAFGHPWRLQFTGTRGIISGVTARYRTELLQTDAPINQGNSGGPLISLENARVVGINTAGIRGAQNTNFAVAIKYACRVLELLQQGKDPSPPDLKLVYFRDIDDRKELKVARSYAGEGMLQLMPGDLIRQVVGVDTRIENETQLLHALRGRLDDARLMVVRSGNEMQVAGAKLPMQRVLEARGVYASGVLFGPVTIRDAVEIGVRGLMVHFVESGSIGESREIEKSDLLEAVDGAPVPDLETLYATLQDAAQSGRRVTLTFKKLSGGDSLFIYTQRTLPVSEPLMIGPQPATRAAEAPLR
ncbi:MAG TPA: trypsin-like peptidase domain-containing protein [Burkholderiales bacterium]|nr:trypsin-like peptidase domain-containing protein [Burkholderiales bacterium]